MEMAEPTIFEMSRPGRSTVSLPPIEVPAANVGDLLPGIELRSDLNLPEVSELDVVRHFTRLSQLNYCVDTNFYPLGSCTMKYNPKVSEAVVNHPGFVHIHPYQPESTVQGALHVMYTVQALLAEISGMDAVSLQPAAGAQGELSGMLMVRAYHRSRGDLARTKVIIPDSAHGTNPATATMSGFTVVNVRSNARGVVDLDELRRLADGQLAAIMLTIPNTLGLFDERILEITDIVHQAGGLVYCDGANLNAILGKVKLGDLGCDVVHFNLHKTFATPHGGGGPGAGPVGARSVLAPFLPVPLVSQRGDGTYYLDDERPNSIGKVKSFYGNFAVVVRACAYLLGLGERGLRQISENAVLNANYLRERLKRAYLLPYDRVCMHEFVLSGRNQKVHGVKTLDIAKRLLDYGFHAPTVYFPLIVDEALMIEPTETESKETLDRFAEAMLAIAEEAALRPEEVTTAPHQTAFGRLNEVEAARRPNLCFG
ncbi:MAG: aminomethyl-transferring glycine dehydrogenase subunit GcvPB [Chloroflexota bacterium]